MKEVYRWNVPFANRDCFEYGRNKFSRFHAVHESVLDIFDSVEEQVQSAVSEIRCEENCIREEFDRRTAISVSGTTFSIKPIARIHQGREISFLAALEVSMERDGVTGVILATPILFGFAYFQKDQDLTNNADYFFIEQTRKFVIVSRYYVQIWSLPGENDKECVLELLWQIQDRDVDRQRHPKSYGIEKIYVCKRGQHLILERYLQADKTKRSDFIVPVNEPCSKGTMEWFYQGISILANVHKAQYSALEWSAAKYINRFLNIYPNPKDYSVSVMFALIKSWSPETQKALEKTLKSVLNLYYPKLRRWIPREDYTRDSNPLCHLINLSISQPKKMDLANIIIDYCIPYTGTDGNFRHLSPVYGCLGMLIEQPKLHHERTLNLLRRLAFIQVSKEIKHFIIDHHSIAHAPTWFGTDKRRIYECENPILQVQLSDKKPDQKNDNFTQDLFVASFDMLWDVYRLPPENTGQLKLSWKRALVYAVKYKCGRPYDACYSMFCVIWKMCTRNPQFDVLKDSSDQEYEPKCLVVCHDFSLEALDNPAIASLTEYKWNKFVFRYWMIRFCFQCVYYALILSAVFLQASRFSRAPLWLFTLIIMMAFVFLYLELLQLSKNPYTYFSSPYNFLDLMVFLLPLFAGIDQIFIRQLNNANGGTTALSYSVLFIFLHLLFELRVNKSVCKFVSIILSAMIEIKVFFIIVGCGVLAFAIAMMHLLHACPVPGCTTHSAQFPSKIFGAISSTYFFAGGIYDPVADLFPEGGWSFHILMMAYFFFTVILMMNVLIALINTAFNKSDDNWKLIWLQNRLRYVEEAENISYHIPGFRQTHDWFPKEIYYTATPSDVLEYRERFLAKKEVPTSEKAVTQLSEAVKKEIESLAKNQEMDGRAAETNGRAAEANGRAAETGFRAAETSFRPAESIPGADRVLMEPLWPTA